MNKGQEKQKETSEQEEKELDKKSFFESLGDFQIFPLELLQMIFSYVEYPYIINCIKINHYFYGLITSYSQVGVKGVANKPRSMFYSTRWRRNEWINFENRKFRELSPKTIPSFLFYRIMGEAKSLPQTFWPYLQGTKIHTLNFSQKRLGFSGVFQLAEVLSYTQIHTLDLSCNELGDAGVIELAKVLPCTKIHTLDLSHNEIGAAVGYEFYDHIHRKMIRIGLEGTGLEALAESLPSTKIHTLNLGDNKIGTEGAIKLAKALPNTQIHMLNLFYNQIGSLGAIHLEATLPNTQIHTLHLGGNGMGNQTKESLRQKCPNIKFVF